MEIFEVLNALGINFQILEHEAVFTVEQSRQLRIFEKIGARGIFSAHVACGKTRRLKVNRKKFELAETFIRIGGRTFRADEIARGFRHAARNNQRRTKKSSSHNRRRTFREKNFAPPEHEHRNNFNFVRRLDKNNPSHESRIFVGRAVKNFSEQAAFRPKKIKPPR